MQSTFTKCHGCSSRRAAGLAGHSRNRSRQSVRVYAVNYDPENLFKGSAPKEGLIERRMMAKQMQTDKQFAAIVTQAQDEDRKKVLLRRQSRAVPTDHIELVEFFLNTQADDMEVRKRAHYAAFNCSVWPAHLQLPWAGQDAQLLPAAVFDCCFLAFVLTLKVDSLCLNSAS
jgi:hypothetical protein